MATDTLKAIRSLLARGLTVEELEPIKGQIVAPGFTVWDYIQMSMDFDEVIKENGKYRFARHAEDLRQIHERIEAGKVTRDNTTNIGWIIITEAEYIQMLIDRNQAYWDKEGVLRKKNQSS